jgi:putative DNA primase/helicase
VQDLSTALSEHHRKEIIESSAISAEVADERGYVTVARPKAGLLDAYGRDTREQLRAMGFPAWATREDYYYPGLLIPQYTPAGVRYAGQFKPARAVPNREGKPQRYASAKGPARLDVHPRWSRDRGGMQLAAIQDPTERLWITEGVKKADSLTSRGEVTVALAGVYSWRNTHAALGDWEDVRIRGREIVVCFDADAVTKPHVAQAMARLGKWLTHKGAAKVWYLTVPPMVEGSATKGVDDWFAAGGTLKALEQAFEKRPPQVTDLEDRFTDARLAETLAAEALEGAFTWAPELGWLGWDGRYWREVDEAEPAGPLESARRWALQGFQEAVAKLRLDDKGAAAEVDGWRGLLSRNRLATVVSLTRGVIGRRAEEFDADKDILNTPSGMVHLVSGEVLPHDPDALCTKITSGSYKPGYRHPDWTRALEALPTDVMTWLQTRIGQALTGYTSPDGVVPILKGGGENAKGLLFTDGILPACGGYAAAASPKLFEKGQHSTEQADLRGQRLVVVEELTEGRSIDVTSLKRIADVGRIKARKVHKDNMEFTASHSLFATTNYTPIIAETDHGTWRRLAMVIFPYTYVKPGEPIRDPAIERRGDPTLKARIQANATGQHDAIVTWAVEGAVRWYQNMEAIERGAEVASVLLPPMEVRAATLAWRVEADRILGYWTHCLVADPCAVILTSELVDHFNEWLRAGGHSPWSKETFLPRFADHAETKVRRVARGGRVRTATRAIVRPGGPIRGLPTQAEVFVGVRWRTDADDL